MIESERVRLRGAEKEDIPRFVAWLNDPEVTDGLLIYWPLSLGQEEDWFAKNLQKPVDEQALVIEAKTDENWTAIGNSSFMNVNLHDRLAEVGIFIGDKRFWNQGYGKETMRLLLKFGFDRLNLNKVYLHVFETNKRAIRCYEQVGFVHEGLLREDIFKNGKYLNVHVMSVLRLEWQQMNREI